VAGATSYTVSLRSAANCAGVEYYAGTTNLTSYTFPRNAVSRDYFTCVKANYGTNGTFNASNNNWSYDYCKSSLHGGDANNDSIERGDKLCSSDRLYYVRLGPFPGETATGNLVLYKCTNAACTNITWKWQTNTTNGFRLIMQGNQAGNLVLYPPPGGPPAVWSSNGGNNGWLNNWFVVQGDCNLVTYMGNTATWNSGTYHCP